jgi:hypothetical protein
MPDLDRLGEQSSAPWDIPIPFDELPVPAFPTEVLPGWLRDFVEAEAIATQTPPDLAAMLALAVIAASCGGRARVRLKDGYEEPLNVFTVTVLAPGNRKSAVFRAVTAPVEAFEAEESEHMRERIACALQVRRVLEAQLKLAEDRAARAEKKERDGILAEAARVRRERDLLIVPTQPRLIVDDCSPERLASLLHDHAGRIALLSPEGDVFDMMAGRYSSNGVANLGVYLKGHAGDPLRVDRQGRGAEFVGSPALTLGLTIQPEVLRGLMSRPGFRGRGLLARFLYSVPRSTLGRRDVDAPSVPSRVSAGYAAGVQGILRLPAGIDAGGSCTPHLLETTQEARAVLLEFERCLEPQIGEFGELAHIADWAAKLAGAVGRLAGLLHFANFASHSAPWQLPVDRECAENAIRIGDYLVLHARAAFGQMGADLETEHARFLLAWLHRAGCRSFTKRDAFEATKGRFKLVAAMEPALELMAEHRFIRLGAGTPRTGPGRRASPGYEVNPAWLSQDSHYSQSSPGDIANIAKCARLGDHLEVTPGGEQP